jgi:hypothetical protein
MGTRRVTRRELKVRGIVVREIVTAGHIRKWQDESCINIVSRNGESAHSCEVSRSLFV